MGYTRAHSSFQTERGLGHLSANDCRTVTVTLYTFRPKVRHAGILSTCNPAIFRAADAMESVGVSPSSMSYVVSPRLVSTDVDAFIGNR
jgi:hypothetical protein